MQPEITMEEHTPVARCYVCGSPKIIGLCHHCGRAMCGADCPAVASPAEHPVSKEFAGLGISDRATAYHCTPHDHVVKGDMKRLVWIGAGIGALGICVALASVIAGVLLILCGGAMVTGAVLVTRRRAEAARAARPPLPLVPDLVTVRVTETLHGKIHMSDRDDYKYDSTPNPVRGQIDVTMEFTDPVLALRSYRDKYLLADDEDIQFSAGYAMISAAGEANPEADELGFRLASGPAAIPLAAGNGIAFGGPVAGHSLFTEDGDGTAKWTAQASYGLLPAREPKTVPLWLVPSLVPDSNHRTLELDLQWVPIGDDDQALNLDLFELIELNVPAAWGNVVSTSEGAMVLDPIRLPESEEFVRTVKWKRPKKGPSQSLILAIRFENEIKLYHENQDGSREYHRLTGKIQTSFSSAFSGIGSVAIYHALGAPWHKPQGAKVDIKTLVSVDFDLSLRFIRYQDVWVIPDSAADVKRAEAPEYPVIPDYETVNGLTSELSSSRYYVKRVIENPPRGGRLANLVNRYWDIAGYYYDKVFPIDFHVTVTGEEEYQGGIRANAGSTTAQITVQASYVESDAKAQHDAPDMKAQIERRWEALSELVAKTLNALPQAARPYTPPRDSGRAYQTPAEPSAPTAGQAKTEPQGRRAALMDALLSGRISEQMYLELKADIDAEPDVQWTTDSP